MPNIKMKAWGPFSPLLEFKKDFEANFVCFTSKLRESDQGGFHMFIDVVIEEAWRDEQPSAKQLVLMDKLGIEFNESTTKGQAYGLIAQTLRGLRR